MCINFDEHHSRGSSLLYVNDFFLYRNCLYTHGTSTEINESRYIVSCPELGSDPPFGSDWELGRDIF